MNIGARILKTFWRLICRLIPEQGIPDPLTGHTIPLRLYSPSNYADEVIAHHFCPPSDDHSATPSRHIEEEGGEPVGRILSPRMLFPAPAWSVPAGGPNLPAPDDHYLQQQKGMIAHDWDVLFAIIGLTGRPAVMKGAAFNESCSYLRRCGYVDHTWAVTELGKQHATDKWHRDAWNAFGKEQADGADV